MHLRYFSEPQIGKIDVIDKNVLTQFICSLIAVPSQHKFKLPNNNNLMACTYELLTALSESVIPPPPVSGTLQLPDSYFSLFYKVAKDGHAARFTSPF